MAIIGPTGDPVAKAAVRKRNPNTLDALAKVPIPQRGHVNSVGSFMKTPIAAI